MASDDPLNNALSRILKPIVRLLIGRNVRFPAFADRIKELYVTEAAEHFRLEDKRMTDSRISMLTGLQRKDIRVIRARLESDADPRDTGAGLLPRVIANWLGRPDYQDGRGRPIALPRSAETGEVSFESLISEISKDVHPRTALDELVRLGLIVEQQGMLRLQAAAFVSGADDPALLAYFGANLGDHAEAAIRNVIAAPQLGSFFERAVHYNTLSPQSIEELEDLSRKLQTETLQRLNARALELQQRDRGDKTATGRFRCGAFVYRETPDRPAETSGP